ncbi:acyl carrier protein, partial [Streptomyces daliensis]|nr:acyl carrier protein [Streptomyces daliensis]
RLDEYGMDSLMAARILVSLQQRYGVEIPPMELLRSNGTIDDFARIVHIRLGLGGNAPGSEAGVRIPAQAQAPAPQKEPLAD